MSYTPNSSNLNSTISAATSAVATTATTASGGTATIAIADAFTAIADYINASQTSQQYRSNVAVASQKFNELVAAVNSLVQ